MRSAAEIESTGDAPVVRPGRQRPVALASEQRESRGWPPAAELLRRKRQQRDEIEAALDWATNRVWAEWFHRQWRAQRTHRRAGRLGDPCLDCPVSLR